MKKLIVHPRTDRKLQLATSTIRRLEPRQLETAHGAATFRSVNISCNCPSVSFSFC